MEKAGVHFRRQAPRDNYVVDFVCLKHRLIVEVDGGQHNFDAHAQRDAQRDNHFSGKGFRVLRFWNNEIDRNSLGGENSINGADGSRILFCRFAQPDRSAKSLSGASSITGTHAA
jgi:very-short-patch-repair endonuclease